MADEKKVEKNIVAIELGSSAVRAILGQKRADGSLQILGFEKESAPDSIHKGVVYNVDKTIQAIVAVIKRLEERQKVYVNKVYVGVTGQSLRSVGNTVMRQFDEKVTISDEIVESLKHENTSQDYPDCEIIDCVVQEYRIGNHLTNSPRGVIADRIEGFYKNIIARKSLEEGISRCFQGAKLEIAGIFIAPLRLADYLLTEQEKRAGCALIDFGAETTTVAVYEKDILRHLAVIPLGGNNITNDIASLLHIEHVEAESLKRTYGSAYTEESEERENRLIEISNNRQTDEKRLQAIVEARQQEILANVWEQIKDYTDRLISGLIFTGGAANMPQLESAFVKYHNYKNIKTRQLPTSPEFTTVHKLDPQTNNFATLVALLKRGDEECTSERPSELDLFDSKERETPTFEEKTPVDGDGSVKTYRSHTSDTTEDGSQSSMEDGQPTEEEQAPEPKPKRPSALARVGRWFREAAGKLVEE